MLWKLMKANLVNRSFVGVSGLWVSHLCFCFLFGGGSIEIPKSVFLCYAQTIAVTLAI